MNVKDRSDCECYCSAEEHGGERTAGNVADLQVHKTSKEGEAGQSSITPAQVSSSYTQVSRANGPNI